MGWGFLMAAYYVSLACFAVGPDRLAAWVAPHAARAKARLSGAGGVTARAASGLVSWAKAINWRDPESLLEVHL